MRPRSWRERRASPGRKSAAWPSNRSSPSPASIPSTRSSGTSALRRSPTTPARRSSSKRTSRCRRAGACWRPRSRSRNIFTATSRMGLGPEDRRGARARSKQLVHRVTRTITDWGVADGYFRSPKDAEVFYNELTWLCVNQHGAFNSPVWFNVGLYHQYGIGSDSGRGQLLLQPPGPARPTAPTRSTSTRRPARCFIQGVDDNMESIMELARSEAMLFKFGSGTGSDLSTIRSTREKMTGGGKPSGPLSFLKVYDQIANVGEERRQDAPRGEDEHAEGHAPGHRGVHPGQAEGGAESLGPHRAGLRRLLQRRGLRLHHVPEREPLGARQRHVHGGGPSPTREYWTRTVRDGKNCEKKRAKDLLYKIAEGTWICGDPGMQFDDTIHGWHTCKGTDRPALHQPVLGVSLPSTTRPAISPRST